MEEYKQQIKDITRKALKKQSTDGERISTDGERIIKKNLMNIIDLSASNIIIRILKY